MLYKGRTGHRPRSRARHAPHPTRRAAPKEEPCRPCPPDADPAPSLPLSGGATAPPGLAAPPVLSLALMWTLILPPRTGLHQPPVEKGDHSSAHSPRFTLSFSFHARCSNTCCMYCQLSYRKQPRTGPVHHRCSEQHICRKSRQSWDNWGNLNMFEQESRELFNFKGVRCTGRIELWLELGTALMLG